MAKESVNGRPQTYDKEFCDKEADLLLEWIKKDGNIFFNQFALTRGYPRENYVEFCERSERFRHSYALAKQWQEAKIFEGGIKGTLKEGFSKFCLLNLHGYQEKSTVIVNQFPDWLKVDSSKDLVSDDKSLK